MGVSQSDFAKQVLSMLLPVFLLNKRTFQLHLMCYSVRFPVSTLATTINMGTAASSNKPVVTFVTIKTVY